MTNSPPDRPEPPESFEPPRADDLPHGGDGRSDPPPGVFDRPGPGEPGSQAWVPERATPAASPSVVDQPPTSSPPAPAGQVLGRRIKPWQFLVGLALVFVPLIAWLAISLGNRPEQPPQVTVTRPSPSPFPPPSTFSPSPRPTPSASTFARPSVRVPSLTAPVPGSNRKPRNPSPPSAVAAPGLKITPIPTIAKTIRFEVATVGGLPMEVSFRDRTHDTVNYPVRTSPFAIELPVAKASNDREYYSVTARILYDSRPDKGADVLCRVVVDGVVVSSQQRRDYASCYISPTYDIGPQ